MPPIPKFAQVLAKRAKKKPEVILKNSIGKKLINTKPKKFANNKDMAFARVLKKEIKKDSGQSLLKKAKNNLYETVDISKIELTKKLEIYKTGEKVRIYDTDSAGNFVEIIWPIDPTVKNIISLTRNQILNGKIKKY